MASVTGMTAAAIDELFADMVVSVRVSDTGRLIYETKDGTETDGGPVVPPIEAVDLAYPIDSLFFSTVPGNPHDQLGVGTWARFGKGKTLVSLDELQPEFDTPEETGGEKTHTLITAEMPAHTHAVHATFDETQVATGTGSPRLSDWEFGTAEASDRAGVTDSTGGGTAHNNLQPYIVVYIWKRTA